MAPQTPGVTPSTPPEARAASSSPVTSQAPAEEAPHEPLSQIPATRQAPTPAPSAAQEDEAYPDPPEVDPSQHQEDEPYPDPPVVVPGDEELREAKGKGKEKAENEYFPPECDIIFVRHGQANSNVVAPDGVTGEMITWMRGEELVKWAFIQVALGIAASLKRGEFAWDGLTQYGIDSMKDLRLLWRLIANICLVVCSSLTRSLQTAELVFPQSSILVHHDFQEATNWPHDIPPVTYSDNGAETTTYIMLKGGDGPDCGQPLERKNVRMRDFVWLGEKPPTQTRDERRREILTPPTLDSIEARAQRARHLLHDVAVKAARLHKQRGRDGIPKIVCVTHCGFLNFLTGHWHCLFTRPDEQSDWRYIKSSMLNNGDTLVFRFQPVEGNKYNLVEQPRSEEYAPLGGFYKVLKEIAPELRNPDGSVVNQREHYMRFNRRVADDVLEAYERNPTTFDYLSGVPGPTIAGEMGDLFNLTNFQGGPFFPGEGSDIDEDSDGPEEPAEPEDIGVRN